MKKNIIDEKNLPQNNVLAAEVGLFDLGNGIFAKEFDSKSKVRSVVAIVDEENHLAYGLCPAYLMLCWCPTCLEVVTENIVSGMEATRFLLHEAGEREKKLPAAEFCADYSGYCVEKGEAFLPSKAQMSKIAVRIFSSWHKICNHQVDLQSLFTSTVNEDYCVWIKSFSPTSVSGWVHQCRTFGVIPMVRIEY